MPAHHDKVCGVKVYAHAAFCALEKMQQGGCNFGTRFDCERHALGLCVKAAFGQRALHHTEARVAVVCGNHADVGGDNMRAEVNRQIDDGFGLFHAGNVILFSLKTVAAHIAAEG